MYEPPPGYGDMVGDASDVVPPIPRYRTLFVDDKVGEVQALKPMPTAVPTLAMAGRDKATEDDRLNYLVMFVLDHIGEDEYERLVLEQMTLGRPQDTIGRVARALLLWGTERPYTAVVTLSVMAAHHWRLLRLEFQGAGIDRPMELPSMHILLDRIERIVLESMQTSKPAEDARRRKSFLDKLYQPDPKSLVPQDLPQGRPLTKREKRELREAALADAPPGFDEGSMEANFDAFTRS